MERAVRKTIRIGERREGLVPGWWCEVWIVDVRYDVGILVIPETGSRPDTWAVVRDGSGRVIWQDRIAASLDARQILRLAGLL